ncbi:cell division protein FtsX [Chryseobacterium sp. H1D6B]|uniref:hypothetical protein n=1 Tax=Chryseobacterium sp. H1D6B TaxID=2940588 RepID=UPI0015C72C1B|nr:hypothetical protein [Chryseobacterium sp. H1D6B]MDH6254407.1 cell division protein FtsX [Chryseobacterium sp. H1D6B]
MRDFIKYDYYIQLFFLIAGTVTAVFGFFLGLGCMLFYFVVGIPQLVSFLIKAFQQTKKSMSYIVYGIFIIPVWLSILIVLAFNNEADITNFFGYILIISLVYSPLLAVLYVYDNYKLYQSNK